ncbi:hypothetical protein Pla175_27500 [Pirellulimonas nuda]|uniref:Outer membrane efflux protein n=1 Tax=Pirellulimonas nuda TaxID=2528009 RepID=A0A518DD07_9BACT|nr:hypothetical protein [Pirellulimonas nuda]QDU89361.1 hypothetical protein Pla175_27500 [Pirellulimonas nuda]
MTRLPILLATLALAAICSDASAQRGSGQSPRYTPATPTLSPYLGLLSNQGGALPNYFALVRPLQKQQAINRDQTLALQRQEVQIERTRQEFGQLEVRPTGTAAWFNNPPQSGGFQNRSHYFGQWDSRANVGRRR